MTAAKTLTDKENYDTMDGMYRKNIAAESWPLGIRTNRVSYSTPCGSCPKTICSQLHDLVYGLDIHGFCLHSFW